MKIVIGAVISRYPYVPGSVWNRIQRLLGFQRLGHEVFFIEEISPLRCVDASGQPCAFDRSINRKLFQATMNRFEMMDKACQIYNRGEDFFGISRHELIATCREADLLINMSGHVWTELVLENVKRRVFVDEDPVYTQLWHSEYGADQNLSRHHIFFSVGLNIGTPFCPIPACGVKWHHFLPPTVLDIWPSHFNASCKRFSTIAAWSEFGDLCYQSKWYRSKVHEFERFAPLPKLASQEMEVCLRRSCKEESNIQFLRDNGWIVTESGQAADLTSYQKLIAGSRAEIGIAKNAYVESRSGWFSDRSAHYLASGKPVLAQSTAIEHALPTGRGLLTFENLEEAVAGVETINSNYEIHCRAARAFAEEFLDYRKVLPQMLEVCMSKELSLPAL
jgi:hypothetical protein